MFTWISAWAFIISVVTASNNGNPLFDSRIVGGREVYIEEFPFQVSISRNKMFICGGSIIEERYVLTARHCTEGGDSPESYEIRAGSSYSTENGTLHKVTKIINHEGFIHEKYRMVNDIAILQVSPSFTIDSQHKPIELFSKFDILNAGDLASISGFGKTSEKGKPSRRLLATEIPIIDWRKCYDFYITKKNMTLTNDFICAGVPKNDQNTCQGDSGGPLVVNNKLAGVVSWGIGCTIYGFPGVYTSVPYFRNWIYKKIEEHERKRCDNSERCLMKRKFIRDWNKDRDENDPAIEELVLFNALKKIKCWIIPDLC